MTHWIAVKPFCNEFRILGSIVTVYHTLLNNANQSFHQDPDFERKSWKRQYQNYSSLGGLRQHVDLVHDGIKPFPCDLCGLGFTTKLYLARHIASEKCMKPLNGQSKEAPGVPEASKVQQAPENTGVSPPGAPGVPRFQGVPGVPGYPVPGLLPLPKVLEEPVDPDLDA